MTTLSDRPNTALIVVDVQNAVVADAYRRDTVVANIGDLVDRARREGVAVVWVRHHDDALVAGSDGWQIVPDLVPHPDEPIVDKQYGDSFESTTLESVLSSRGVGRLVVVGAETDACVRSTLHGAFYPGVRHRAGERRPHRAGKDPLGGTISRVRDRAHQPVLDTSACAWTHCGDDDDCQCRVFRTP
ncbi:isochorismatase family protein [Mycolicibacterium sp. OfavD-34-C]|uniref:isochorismatase family protein n=1 Tax=Mycolicibacterium sp. OfavD-34-C TaxID=2917746 RepID=UPI0012A97EE6|nr:isochorismatase family protein [Mycolicibacterium sp. OfavD-34-C]QFS93556.1 Peroxyureidoacrylate/ureidoacrylate amidohydrolase RutB [Mycobacterium sp. THAF192]